MRTSIIDNRLLPDNRVCYKIYSSYTPTEYRIFNPKTGFADIKTTKEVWSTGKDISLEESMRLVGPYCHWLSEEERKEYQ